MFSQIRFVNNTLIEMPAIIKGVAEGIPTVVYDSDVPSNRDCFLGSDWYMMGQKQGEAIGILANGKKAK